MLSWCCCCLETVSCCNCADGMVILRWRDNYPLCAMNRPAARTASPPSLKARNGQPRVSESNRRFVTLPNAEHITRGRQHLHVELRALYLSSYSPKGFWVRRNCRAARSPPSLPSNRPNSFAEDVKTAAPTQASIQHCKSA